MTALCLAASTANRPLKLGQYTFVSIDYYEVIEVKVYPENDRAQQREEIAGVSVAFPLPTVLGLNVPYNKIIATKNFYQES